MKKTLILRSCSLALSALVIAQTGCRQAHELRPDHPRMAAGVVLRDVTFHSKALGREMSYRVFLPATLEAGVKLPVVYLLHGGGGGFEAGATVSSGAGRQRR